MTCWSRAIWTLVVLTATSLACACTSSILGTSKDVDLEILQTVLNPLTESLGSRYLVLSAKPHAINIDSDWIERHSRVLDHHAGIDLAPMLIDYQIRNVRGLLPAHIEGPRIRLVNDKDLDRIFFGDALGGWRRFWAAYPDSSGMAEISLPGYSRRKDRAIVSYFISRGSTAGEAMVILLHRDSRSWLVDWSDILFET